MTKPVSIQISIIATMLLVSMTAQGFEGVISDEARARLEPTLKKSGGELTYFDGPGEMIGIGVSFTNGKQMVVYATPDGRTVFSGVAIDVETGQNLSNADLQRLPAPDYGSLVEMLANSGEETGRALTLLTEGNPESTNRYFVFFDPKCPYCHRTYDNFLALLAEGNDLVVHYIPIGLQGPDSENLAKELVGLSADGGLELIRKLVRREPHLADANMIAAGARGHGANLAMFRQLQFDVVPIVISDVSGVYNVRRGAVATDVLQQELRVAAVQKLASAK